MLKIIEIIGPPGSGKTFISNELKKIKIDNKKIFFHSGQKQTNRFNNLNFFFKFIINLKVITTIIIFYLIFSKRLFLKKIYKRKFFFRICLIIYRDLISIEVLKKTLTHDKYLLMEPGIIMHFLQDYFYTKSKISKIEIKIFNKLFVKSNFIICTHCNHKLSIKRVHYRERGLPQRMRSLNLKEKNNVIKKSINEIKNYISYSSNLNLKVIRVNTSQNIKNIKKIILEKIM
jgi:dephospho-CoA kinase